MEQKWLFSTEKRLTEWEWMNSIMFVHGKSVAQYRKKRRKFCAKSCVVLFGCPKDAISNTLHTTRHFDTAILQQTVQYTLLPKEEHRQHSCVFDAASTRRDDQNLHVSREHAELLHYRICTLQTFDILEK